MTGYIWETHRVRLRAVRPEDWEAHWRWGEDSDTARHLDRLAFPQSPLYLQRRALEAAERSGTPGAAGGAGDDSFAFELETPEGRLAGNLTTHHCDPRAGTFSYGVAVLPDHRRCGLASDAVRLVLRFYFAELRYQKVTVAVYDFNLPSVRLHERLGFLQEGRLRRAAFTGGRFCDTLVFGMTVEEFAARTAA